MLDMKCGVLSGCVLAILLACGMPTALSATKGLRVRSSPDIPATDFTCADRPPGYYADLETGCQVYHMCTEGGNQFSYRCPNTTLFQQRMLICAHWYQVNCSRSEQHYGANLLIGQRDKPFVNDDPALAAKVKTLKTLHNPEVLQTLGPSSENDDSPRQPKAQSSNNNIHANNFKRDGGISFGFVGQNKPFHNGLPTTVSPANRRTTENLSKLPLAGSVLPGGVKSFQFSQSPNQGFTPSSQPFRTTTPPQQFATSTSSPRQFSQAVPFTPTQFSQAASFSPTPTPNTINKVSFTPTTKSAVSFGPRFFTENQNKFQPSGFQKQSVNLFNQDSTDEPSLEFLPPQDQQQFQDLAVASQENALSGRRTTTTPPPPPPPQNPGIMESLSETTVKAEIEHTQNGSQPVDRFNTFIKRFNPYEEAPAAVTDRPDKQEEPQQEQHVFINRFVPDVIPPEQLDNRGAQPEQHVFINRFVLTPEEKKQEKDRQSINNLHNFLPPTDQFQINFPKFDLMPPFDDSDDSESNKIELHLNDPRRNLFIPDDNEDAFSRADAAPIVVTIPLHSHQKSPPMWFRAEHSEDACSRCHSSFIVNKETCMPCVIIR